MCVSVYVCMCVCVYVCMYVCERMHKTHEGLGIGIKDWGLGIWQLGIGDYDFGIRGLTD